MITNASEARVNAPAGAFLTLLEQAAEKLNVPTPNEEMGRILIDQHKLPQNPKYFANKYHELKNKAPHEVVAPQEAPFNALAKLTGHESFKSYLTANGYPIHKKNTAGVRSPLAGKQPDAGKLHALQQYNTINPAQSSKKYYWRTQVVPALFAFVPLFLSISTFYALPSPALIALTIGWVVASLLMAEVIAGMGKSIEKKLLEKDGIMQYPTVTKMIYASVGTFSNTQKEEYRQKISALFHVTFPTRQEEAADSTQAIICLNDTINKLKEYVKTSKIESAHIRYVQYRNLLPALFTAATFTLLGIIGTLLRNQQEALYLHIGLLAGIITLFFIIRKITLTSSEAFAQYFVEEFLRREV